MNTPILNSVYVKYNRAFYQPETAAVKKKGIFCALINARQIIRLNKVISGLNYDWLEIV
jgi:hypothetical protein